MANILKNLDLFSSEPDSWRKDYWVKKNQNKDNVDKMAERINKASVETVIKPRNKEDESADFFKAQHDMAKDILPKQTIAEDDKMKMTPTEAFIETYPNRNPKPQSAAMKPTSIIAEYPSTGYSGKDGIPQGNIGTLMLDVKGNTSKWVGNHYLPKETQDGKQDFTPPKTQISAWDAQKFDDGGMQVQGNKCNKMQANIGINIGKLIEEVLTRKNMNNVIDMSASITSIKEKRSLNKPFKTPGGKACYAVYTRDNKNELIRVDFNACKACDETNLGPTWQSKYWASKVNEAAAASAKEVTMDDFWNSYTEKVTDPKLDLDWDGRTFYRQADLLKTMPELINSKPSYEDETVVNKDPNTASSAPVNSLRN